ncbi:hypothetical protein C8R43DRAFT_190556 [Mycena crocata]|nr:hypothetical protein C8R43DRAFT_190556 [Mycena crocata]
MFFISAALSVICACASPSAESDCYSYRPTFGTAIAPPPPFGTLNIPHLSFFFGVNFQVARQPILEESLLQTSWRISFPCLSIIRYCLHRFRARLS